MNNNAIAINMESVKFNSISHADLVAAVNMNRLYTDLNAPAETTTAIQLIADWAGSIIASKPEVLQKLTIDWELKKERVYLKRNGKVFFKARANKNDVVVCIPGRNDLGSHGAFGDCAARVDWQTATKLLNEAIG